MPSEVESKEPPSILWHYTTQPGLIGIIGSRELWASHIRFLNDSRELGHSLDIFEQVLQAASDAGRIAAAMVRTIISSIRQTHEPDARHSTFVTSLSQAEDDISQWRAYAPGEVGYAMGFNPARFPKDQTEAWPVRLMPCIYDRSEQEAAFNEISETILSMLSVTTPLTDAIRVRVSSLAFLNFMRLAPRFKHRAFKHEQEWRLASQRDAVGSKTLRGVRSARSFLVPHLRLPLAELLDLGLDEIIVGPCQYPELAVAGLRSLLDSHDISRDVRIRQSKVPFRSV